MNRLPSRAAILTRSWPLLAALVLAGCGGGGGATDPDGGTAGSIPDAATASFVPSQAGANALVADAVQRSRDMRLASGLTATSLAAGAGGNGSLMLGPQALAIAGQRRAQSAADYTAALCSSGSATLDVADAVLQRFSDADPGNDLLLQGEGMSLSTAHCVIRAAAALGDVSLGSFGAGDTIDGAFALTLTRRSGSDVVWTLRYTGFSYTPYGGAAFAPLDATLVFGTVGGVGRYALDIAGTRFLSAPRVSQVGRLVTVSAGSLRGAVPAAAGSGWADYSYSGWVLDSVALTASAGSVTALGANGAKAVVAADGGGYAVTFTVAGASTRYTVAR